MKIIVNGLSNVNHQVRLPSDLNEFVLKTSTELNCSKSEAIRAMIRACKENQEKGE